MKVKNLENDEVIILETEGFINKNKNISKIILTNKEIIIENKGLLKQKKNIKFEDIKMYKNNVQIKLNQDELAIQTTKENISIKCDSNKTAKKILNIIKEGKCGSVLQRAHTKIAGAEKEIIAVTGIATIAGKAVYKALEASGKVPKNPFKKPGK